MRYLVGARECPAPGRSRYSPAAPTRFCGRARTGGTRSRSPPCRDFYRSGWSSRTPRSRRPSLDDHFRLPAAVHHNPVAMAALNFLAALALTHVFRSAIDLPTRISYAVAATTRCWWDHLLHVIGLVLRLEGAVLPRPGRPPLPAVTLPRPHALTALLHRAQPCAP